MISAQTTDAAEPAQRCTTAAAPLLLSVREARRQFGDIGTTAFYDAVKRHGIQLVKLGGRSLVPMADVERVVAQLIAERPADTSDKAKALALRSVAARRARRGSTAAQPAAAPSLPATTRRRCRGSTAA